MSAKGCEGFFQQKILNCTVVGARQSFQFFREIIWFLGNKLPFPKFKYWILQYLISIIKLQNYSPVKPNFMLTTRATLSFSKKHMSWKNSFAFFDISLSSITFLCSTIFSIALKGMHRDLDFFLHCTPSNLTHRSNYVNSDKVFSPLQTQLVLLYLKFLKCFRF